MDWWWQSCNGYFLESKWIRFAMRQYAVIPLYSAARLRMKERENAFYFPLSVYRIIESVQKRGGWVNHSSKRACIYIYLFIWTVCVYLTKGLVLQYIRLMKSLLLYLASCATYRISCRGNKQGLSLVTFKTRCFCRCWYRWRASLFVGSCQFSSFLNQLHSSYSLCAARNQELNLDRERVCKPSLYDRLVNDARRLLLLLSVNLVCWVQKPFVYSPTFCFLSSRNALTLCVCDAHCLWIVSSPPAGSNLHPLPLVAFDRLSNGLMKRYIQRNKKTELLPHTHLLTFSSFYRPKKALPLLTMYSSSSSVTGRFVLWCNIKLQATLRVCAYVLCTHTTKRVWDSELF